LEDLEREELHSLAFASVPHGDPQNAAGAGRGTERERKLHHAGLFDVARLDELFDVAGTAERLRSRYPQLFSEDLPVEWFSCRAETHSRFATDDTFKLFEFSLWFRTQALGNAGVVMEHDPQLSNATREEVLEMVRQRDPELLARV